MPHGVVAHTPDGRFDIPMLVREARGFSGLEGLDLDGPGPNRFTEWDLAHFEPDRVEESANGSFYDGAWALQYLRSFAGTIAGGTSEIQRNIVAERVLGLPRG